MEEVKTHDKLNPKLWNCLQEKGHNGKTTYILKDEVKAKLKTIAQAFIGYLEIPNDAVKDIRLLGSSANFNYTEHSDLDLHIIIDFDKVHKDCPVVAGYLWAQKSLFNKEHDITIYGIPVEVYAESHVENAVSNGVYSIKEDKWLKEPKPLTNISVDDIAVRAKYTELERAIKETTSQEEAEELLDKIKRMRKAGLEKGGEFSVENIVFKKLRDNELIGVLKDRINTAFDKKLSLKESRDDYSALVCYIVQDTLVDYFNKY
jgi:predicted nucleotidyltransferase